MSNQNSIPTFVINTSQSDKPKRVTIEFSERAEFQVSIVPAIIEKNSEISVEKTVKKIVRDAAIAGHDYIAVCKDTHRFTKHYSTDVLIQRINEAKKLRADILCGGLTGGTLTFSSILKISEGLFWVEDFAGLPFMIIFSSLFKKIENTDEFIFADANKFFCYPFLSFQKKELLDKLNIDGINVIDEPPLLAASQIEILKDVSTFYKKLDTSQLSFKPEYFDNLTIPTYIINLPERTDRLEHIKKQFEGRDEFDIKVVEACKHRVGAVGLWESIRKIIETATDNDDDIIILCEDDHQFTPHYSKEFLFKNILEGHHQQLEMLLGGIGAFTKALPVTDNRAWVNFFLCTQFVVVFKPAFQKILDEVYDEKVIADGRFSSIISNKMVLFPFISTQKFFGYSDATEVFNTDKERLDNMFIKSASRLKNIYDVKSAYSAYQTI